MWLFVVMIVVSIGWLEVLRISLCRVMGVVVNVLCVVILVVVRLLVGFFVRMILFCVLLGIVIWVNEVFEVVRVRMKRKKED